MKKHCFEDNGLLALFLTDAETAIQVCYDLSDATTIERETQALVKI